MESLAELLQKHSLPRESYGTGLFTRPMQALLKTVPYACERKGVNSAVNKLWGDYLENEMMRKYDLLGDELFELERTVEIPLEHAAQFLAPESGTTITAVKRIKPLTFPLIAVAEYGSSSWNYEGKVHVDCTINGRRSYAEDFSGQMDFKLSTPVPLLTAPVKDKASEAMAYAYRVCAGALENKVIRNYLGRVGRENEAPEHMLMEVIKPQLRIGWKPKVSDLQLSIAVPEPPDPDPVLLLRFNDVHYKIATWEVPNEEPLEHILAEYTKSLKK